MWVGLRRRAFHIPYSTRFFQCTHMLQAARSTRIIAVFHGLCEIINIKMLFLARVHNLFSFGFALLLRLFLCCRACSRPTHRSSQTQPTFFTLPYCVCRLSLCMPWIFCAVPFFHSEMVHRFFRLRRFVWMCARARSPLYPHACD